MDRITFARKFELLKEYFQWESALYNLLIDIIDTPPQKLANEIYLDMCERDSGFDSSPTTGESLIYEACDNGFPMVCDGKVIARNAEALYDYLVRLREEEAIEG